MSDADTRGSAGPATSVSADIEAARALGLMLDARIDADELLDRLRTWAVRAKGAYADNTWRAWRADIRVWCGWCRARGRAAFPAAPEDVTAFIAEVGAQGRAVATIRRYMASLSRLHRSARAADPTRDPDDQVMLAVRKLARAVGTRQRQATPMHDTDRDKMVAALGWDDPKGRGRIMATRDIRDAALICTLYDGLFRRAEVIGLRIEDLEFFEEQDGLILLRRSKTDQEGEGDLRYLSPQTMVWINRWLVRLRDAEQARLPKGDRAAQGTAPMPTGPLFRRVRREGIIGLDPLSPNSVVLILERAAKRAKLDQRFSGHSGRVGAAQDLDAQGFTTLQIQGAGAWKSPAMVARYTARGAARTGAMAQMASRRRKEG